VKGMRLTSAIPIFAAVFLPFAASQAHAQDPQPESSSKTSRGAQSCATKVPRQAEERHRHAKRPGPARLDPLRAEKDLEVGQYYMKKGDLDAAIDRFQDATAAKPGPPSPFRYPRRSPGKKKA